MLLKKIENTAVAQWLVPTLVVWKVSGLTLALADVYFFLFYLSCINERERERGEDRCGAMGRIEISWAASF